MRLAIADPPYPPILRADGTTEPRASRWYSHHGTTWDDDDPADHHDDAADYDDPAAHLALLARLDRDYDGWAYATAPDALRWVLPAVPDATRLLVWHKPNSQPGAHRLLSRWEPVLLYPPPGRRTNRGRGGLSDVLTAAPPRRGFRGAKPTAWTAWVLTALSYDPDHDTVDDLFPGSGNVARAVAAYTRACDWCAATFTPARSDARYCSGACRTAAHRDRNRA